METFSTAARGRMSVGQQRRWVGPLVGAGVALAAPLAPAHAQPGAAVHWGGEQHRGENGSGSGKPIDVSLNYASDVNGDISGGQSRGMVYLGRGSALLDADLDELIGLHRTTAHLSFYQLHGIGLSGRHVGNLLLVSGLEAEPAIRLNQVWVQIVPFAAASLRVGKFTAAQEFIPSQTANLFVNSTFGWPASFATDLPSGGPSYPLAAPGARLSVPLDRRITMRVAAFAGDPAGPGAGDPQRRETHGVNTFGFAGQPFVIGEVSRATGGISPTLTATLVGGFTSIASRTSAVPPRRPARCPDPAHVARTSALMAWSMRACGKPPPTAIVRREPLCACLTARRIATSSTSTPMAASRSRHRSAGAMVTRWDWRSALRAYRPACAPRPRRCGGRTCPRPFRPPSKVSPSSATRPR